MEHCLIPLDIVHDWLYTSAKLNYFLLHFQAPICEHAFCKECIHEWLSRQPTCPVDRQALFTPQLKPVPRILKNLLSRWVDETYLYVWVRYSNIKSDITSSFIDFLLKLKLNHLFTVIIPIWINLVSETRIDKFGCTISLIPLFWSDIVLTHYFFNIVCMGGKNFLQVVRAEKYINSVPPSLSSNRKSCRSTHNGGGFWPPVPFDSVHWYLDVI